MSRERKPVEQSEEEIRAALLERICPFCGKGPYKSIAIHVSHSHGIDRRTLRDMAGITYETKLTDPELSQKFSKSAKATIGSKLGSRGSVKGHKKQLSRAAKKQATERILANSDDD